ncbi:hypothetical protein ACFQV2_37580 [Actinokineospora soli]|uniref:LD-carboxypeptidase C-terminal domain-containing protein n=1 Tax=Actinokineospora soli TaxID=1048753 RepID=A0ABW2TZP3_9PSEU
MGFSDTTILQLAIWRETGIPSLHGGVASWNAHRATPALIESARRALTTTDPIVLHADPTEPTAALTTSGKATGFLMGGNLSLVATGAGWALPDLHGAILLLEDIGLAVGMIDRLLTLLHRGGSLTGLRGIALGQFTDCPTAGGWTAVDILRDRLTPLNVPILGGLPTGHGPDTRTVALGTPTTLDADNHTLTTAPGVA